MRGARQGKIFGAACLGLVCALLVLRPGGGDGSSRRAHADAEAIAFTMLPWSRVAVPCDRDGQWRIRLRPAPEPLELRVVRKSCGCLRASIERGAAPCLVLSLHKERRIESAVVTLGFGFPDGRRAFRDLRLVPVHPTAQRTSIAVALHLPAHDPLGETGTAGGRLHAYALVLADAPPGFEGDPRIAVRTWPDAGGGYQVLIQGRASASGVPHPGHLIVDGVRVPLRVYRRTP